MIAATQCVFRFGMEVTDGDGSMGELLGGKGAGLAEMTSLGLPVPPGFTLTTEICRHYFHHGRLPSELSEELAEGLRWLESSVGKRLGDANNPMIVSVRSGAPVSMPGMMDTVLNLGLNDETVGGLARISGSEVFALESYRRLIQMFGTVVLDVPKDAFESTAQVEGGSEVETLLRGIESFKEVVQNHAGVPFPQDTALQLEKTILAVFRSWRSERAVFYRQLNGIADEMGTAVTVQAMVFGNLTDDSGTGVGFTRNPANGEPGIYGEYLAKAQGEDIVAGIRTPTPIRELQEQQPAVYEELVRVVTLLERHYRDTQDFEFTVERGRLFLLQTRAAKRSALAAVRVAVDMAVEGLITRQEAVQRVNPAQLTEMLSPQLDLSAGSAVLLTTGLAASPGAAVGMLALSSAGAVSMSAEGEPTILLTQETAADDIQGMAASRGFLTARGGATSHAAVVARGMGKCCITGAKELVIELEARTVRVGTALLKEGDWISLDGSTGRVFAGKLPMRPASEDHPELDTLLGWAAAISTLEVRANADTPCDAAAARSAGAAGIGLCRTEHMFFAGDRLRHVRAMILADNHNDRKDALNRLLPMQQRDFEEMFRSMSPLPVTIRLLDPPLHEFLPARAEIESEIKMARKEENWELALSLERVRQRVEALSEANPMMGHRGCRLSLTYPEILEMQVCAILQAALRVAEEGIAVTPEIMVPLVASAEEMRVLAAMIDDTAKLVLTGKEGRVDYKVGTMIELPRAALCAASIAEHVSFLSFGTNDLTQMTYGFSRDDAYSFMGNYLEQGILKHDPFVTIDREGVGELMSIAIDSVRRANPAIKIGVCGEHAGDPESIRFFHSMGVDYISCSPARLRAAQLTAAQL